jgi:predicted MPP superfamily phosphohydrolase
VLIAGDFFDNDFGAIREPEKAAELLRGLKTVYGVYACFGNHDAGAPYPQMLRFLQDSHIRLLADETVLIADKLYLAGRMDGSPIGGFGGQRRKALVEILTLEAKDLPVVVLDHNPAHLHEYGEETDLVLCGHTHKGQLFPGGLITQSMYEVDHGYYRRDENSPHVIVTSGAGAWGPPMRVGTDSEINLIRLSW